jgi:cytochrome oxidase Cu insertion factor (SCO1/SenC/PrrC family)
VAAIRTPLAFYVPYLLAVVAVVSGLLWHAGDEVQNSGRTTTSGIADVGGPFALVDQDGVKRTDADFRGRYLLIYFGYSDCPDVCPTTLGVMADTMDKLGALKDRVVPVFITTDPDRDTPAVLKAYLKSFGPEFVGLTGSAAQIAKAAHEYRVYYAKHPLPGGGYSVDHSGALYLMGPDGKFITFYDDESIGPDVLASDIKKRI